MSLLPAAVGAVGSELASWLRPAEAGTPTPDHPPPEREGERHGWHRSGRSQSLQTHLPRNTPGHSPGDTRNHRSVRDPFTFDGSGATALHKGQPTTLSSTKRPHGPKSVG